jgi:hypothetical protein
MQLYYVLQVAVDEVDVLQWASPCGLNFANLIEYIISTALQLKSPYINNL